jgi:hypothetical protein
VVVVVNGNQVAELQVTSSRSSLAGNTLHGASITEEHEGVVVDQLKARLVEDSRSVRLSNGKTDGIGEALTERTSGDLDSGGIVCLGVAGSDAVDLLQAKSVADLGADTAVRESNSHESSSSHQCSKHNRKGGAEHIEAYIHDRCWGKN